MASVLFFLKASCYKAFLIFSVLNKTRKITFLNHFYFNNENMYIII